MENEQKPLRIKALQDERVPLVHIPRTLHYKLETAALRRNQTLTAFVEEALQTALRLAGYVP